MSDLRNFGERSSFRVLLLILLLALGMRMIFYVGVGNEASLATTEDAWDFLNTAKLAAAQTLAGNFPQKLSVWVGGFSLRETVVLAPIAVLYQVFGVGEHVSTLPGLLSSLIGLAALFYLGELFLGRRAAIAASLLWALLPGEIFAATQPGTAQMLPGLFGAGLLGLSYGWKQDKRLLFGLGAGLTLLLLWIDAWLGITLAVTGLMLVFAENEQARKALPYAMAMAAILPLTQGVNWLANFEGLFAQLRAEPGALLLLPLVFLGIAVGLDGMEDKHAWLWAWLGMAVFTWLLRWEEIEALQGASQAHGLVVWMAALLLAGNYLGRIAEGARLNRWLVLLCAGLLLTALLMVKAHTRLIPSFDGWDWLSLDILPNLLSILTGLALLGLLASPVLSERSEQWGKVLLAALLLAMLSAVWDKTADQRAANTAVRASYAALQEKAVELPIYVYQDRQTFNQLRFLAGYSDAVARKPLDVLGEGELAGLNSASLVYWDASIAQPGKTWWREGIYGWLGADRLVVVRILSEADAGTELANAEEALRAEASTETYRRLYAAASNAGELCKAYEAWLAAQAGGRETMVTIPVDLEAAMSCFGLVGSSNVLAELRKSNYIGYFQPHFEGPEEEVESVLSIGHKYLFYNDPRVFDLQRTLEPNSVYLYGVSVQSKDQVTRLYWATPEAEGALDAGTFRDWTAAGMLFVTRDREDFQTVTLSPVLFDHYGRALLRDLVFEQVGVVE